MKDWRLSRLSMKSSLSTLLWLAALGTAKPAGAVPRLLVVISIDQMRWDYLDRYAAEYKGGLKILREEGAVLTAQHAHIPTETGPGHAVILTGRFPDQTGIVGNEWWDRALSTKVYVVADSVYGLGPENLLAYTLGDVLKAKDPESRVVSLSFKDRAAILLGGKKADAALWFDRKKGEFVTSSYYSRPGWLAAFNARMKSEDGPLAEAPKAYYQQLAYTPGADRLLLSLAEEVLSRYGLGKDEHPDILAVSFSATDYIGHRYGSESPQMHEQLKNLDAVLGELIRKLSLHVGKRNFDLVLTSDHGVMPLPARNKGEGPVRILFDEFGASLEKTLQYQFPAKEPWILANEYPNIYLNRALASKLRLDWRVFLRKAAQVLNYAPGVAHVYVADEIGREDRYAGVYRRSVRAGRSGDLLVRVSSGVLVTIPEYLDDHGTPYDYDTRVPLVFWGPDFKSGRFPEPAWVADLAPTCGVLLGVSLPPAEGSRVHDEVFQENRLEDLERRK